MLKPHRRARTAAATRARRSVRICSSFRRAISTAFERCELLFICRNFGICKRTLLRTCGSDKLQALVVEYTLLTDILMVFRFVSFSCHHALPGSFVCDIILSPSFFLALCPSCTGRLHAAPVSHAGALVLSGHLRSRGGQGRPVSRALWRRAEEHWRSPGV